MIMDTNDNGQIEQSSLITAETKKKGKGLVEKAKIQKLFETGFFHIFGGNVINKIITFTSGVVLVRILTKTEYGRFTHAWNIYSILLILSGFGMESGVLQLASEKSKDDNYCKRVFNFGTRFGLKVNTFIGLLLLATGLFVNFKINGTNQLMVMLCVLPIFQLLIGMSNVYLRVKKRNQEFTRLMVINTALVFVFSVALSYFLREQGLVVAYYVAAIITVAVCFWGFKVTLISKGDSLYADEKSILLRYAFVSMLNNGLSQLLFLLDIFVLGIVDPKETVLASYKIATIIPTALVFIPTSLVIYIYPYFAEHRNDKQWCLSHYKVITICLGLFNLVVSSVLFGFASPIIRIVFGAQYSDSVKVFRILAVNYFFSGTFRTIAGNLLATQRRLKFNLVAAIVTSTCNVVANFFFIQRWGSVGAAVATVLSILVSSIMCTCYLIHVFRNIPEKQVEPNGL